MHAMKARKMFMLASQAQARVRNCKLVVGTARPLIPRVKAISANRACTRLCKSQREAKFGALSKASRHARCEFIFPKLLGSIVTPVLYFSMCQDSSLQFRRVAINLDRISRHLSRFNPNSRKITLSYPDRIPLETSTIPLEAFVYEKVLRR